ncbi:MAG: ThiF family adenylyltransferase [Candidatus Omnitrophota bacterium]|nr:ThiF family adenylyltransferase [Candidatus Omnitrophota bacterium]
MDKDKYFYDFLNRCIPLLTKEGVDKLRNSSIAIAGCGGAGGAAAITLARMGVGNFTLADPGIFDEPDINRQWAANIHNLGRNKTDAYEEMLLDINPLVSIKKYREGVADNNVTDFLDGVDLVIDCLDIAVSTHLRSTLHEEARKNGAYSLVAPILSFGAIFCCSAPTGMSMERIVKMIEKGGTGEKFPNIFRKVFMPQHLDIIENMIATHKIPSVPISSMIAAAMLATESILILLDKIIVGSRKPICLPKVIITDFFRLAYHIVDIDTLPLE